MLLEDFQAENVLWVDFNSLEDDDRLPTTLRYASGPRKPRVGERVRIVDSDGDSCLADVLRVQGMLVEVRPEWSTWTTDVPDWAAWSPPSHAAKRAADLREALRLSRQRRNQDSPIEDSPLAERSTSLIGS